MQELPVTSVSTSFGLPILSSFTGSGIFCRSPSPVGGSVDGEDVDDYNTAQVEELWPGSSQTHFVSSVLRKALYSDVVRNPQTPDQWGTDLKNRKRIFRRRENPTGPKRSVQFSHDVPPPTDQSREAVWPSGRQDSVRPDATTGKQSFLSGPFPAGSTAISQKSASSDIFDDSAPSQCRISAEIGLFFEVPGADNYSGTSQLPTIDSEPVEPHSIQDPDSLFEKSSDDAEKPIVKLPLRSRQATMDTRPMEQSERELFGSLLEGKKPTVKLPGGSVYGIVADIELQTGMDSHGPDDSTYRSRGRGKGGIGGSYRRRGGRRGARGRGARTDQSGQSHSAEATSRASETRGSKKSGRKRGK